jgi:hypothetical protein
MKETFTKTTASGIKVTQTEATDKDGIERITVSASTKKNGKLLLAQRVRVNTGKGFKVLYTRSQNGKQIRWQDWFTWFKLGMYLELKNFAKSE